MKKIFIIGFLILAVFNTLTFLSLNENDFDLLNLELRMNSAYAIEGVSDTPCVVIGNYYSYGYTSINGASCWDQNGDFCGTTRKCTSGIYSEYPCQSWSCKQYY